MARLIRFFLFFSILLTCLTLNAQNKRNVLITVRRAGMIEFDDPKTLLPISQLQVDVSPNTGLNGVFVSADGSTIYVEGPTAPNEMGESGCCYLYSIDLANLHAKLVADIWGSSSRGSLLVADRTVYPRSTIPTRVTTAQLLSHEWHMSPNGHWLLGIDRQQHAVAMFDLPEGNNARYFQIPEVNDESWMTGTWSGDNFYLYEEQKGNTARLWNISTSATQMPESVAVSTSNVTADCHKFYVTELVAAGEQLFAAEMFGGKFDRRRDCNQPVTGGASIIDPQSGQLLGQMTPELYFSMLIPDESESELYGLTDENDKTSDSIYGRPVELVRIDAHTGRVLQSRILDGDYWRMAIGKISMIPASHQHMVLPTQ